jgi:hypothetical protein
MTSATLVKGGQGVLRWSRWDALLVGLAAGHGGLLLAVPSAPVVALGLWWNSNTVAHYFLHKPFFRSRALNFLFACYLTLLLGVPQELWRHRHLAHHFGAAWKGGDRRLMAFQGALVLLLWAGLWWLAPAFFLTAYVPGYLAGLALCWLHGHYEHVRGTTSHYGLLYNLLFFNDGYHVEHHRHPNAHWTELPARTEPGADESRWPAVLRWLEVASLDGLEKLVLGSPALQRWVLGRHERAFRKLLPLLPPVRRVAVVGGGLFPRTLLILRGLLPGAHLVVIDRSAESIARARPLAPEGVEYVEAYFDPALAHGFDLLVFPLSFRGDRSALYAAPAAPAVILHDWIWRAARRQPAGDGRHVTGVVVSWLLLKRVNLVTR